MALETGTYPTFVGGVSQQDDTVRSPSQVTSAINAWPHAAMGMGKRPPAQFVKVLASNLEPMSYFHSIVRDAHERYLVAVGHKSIRVFDHETGFEYRVVPTGNALDYLDAHSLQPWSVFKATTWADSTFIVNRNTRVAMDTEMSPGVVAGTAMTLEDLPKGTAGTAIPNGTIYHITGTSGSPFDDYYVKKDGPNAWVETTKPRVPHKLDRRTMPHVLKRIPDPVHGDGMFFSFGPPEWDSRTAGDDRSNPEPSLVGYAVEEVFLHRNRLGLLSTENVLLSSTDAPYNFWRTTVTQVLDDDPIDLAIPTSGVATLHHAVSFQSAVYLDGAGKQFLLTADPYMAAKHARTDTVSNYNSSPYIRPQLLGDSLYSVNDAGAFAEVREYFLDDVSITGDSANITAHAPRYIPGRVRSMSCSTSADMVLFAVDGPQGSQLYSYSVRWAGDDKQQSAWAEWSISGVGKVVHLHTIGESTYAAAEAPGGGVELLRFDLALNQSDHDATEDYTFLLDRLVLVQPTYYALGNYTDVTVPYVIEDIQEVTAIKTDDWADPGAYLDLQGATLVDGGQTVRLPGRHDEGRVAIGLDYAMRLTPSKPMIRQQDGSAVLVGRLQVRDLEVAYRDAAYFDVEVRSKGTGRKETYLASHAGLFTARTLDSTVFKLSSPTFHTGSRRFPVLSNADDVQITFVNDLPFQCWFLSAQWRGLFVSRSRV